MAFWVDWQLWEKLSLALLLLIVLVIIYAAGVLFYNRWRVRRYAVIEALQKGEEAGLCRVLSDDNTPFGARALERGMEVPGIWNSSPNTPASSLRIPGTPTRSRSPSLAPRPLPVRPESPASSLATEIITPSPQALPPYVHSVDASEIDIVTPNIVVPNNYRYEPYKPGGIYPPATMNSLPTSPRPFHRRSDTFTSGEKRASLRTRFFRASQMFESRQRRSGTSDPEEYDLGSFGYEQEPRPPVEHHRGSRFHRLLRRRSSEEFRRRMSQIFNERIHMNIPAEQLQFNAEFPEPSHRRTFRQSILSPFR